MIAVLPLVGKPFLQASNTSLSSPALCLRQPLFGLAQLVRVGHLLASRESQEGLKSWVNADGTSIRVWNALGLRVDAQTEIPARRTLADRPFLIFQQAALARPKGVQPVVSNHRLSVGG